MKTLFVGRLGKLLAFVAVVPGCCGLAAAQNHLPQLELIPAFPAISVKRPLWLCEIPDQQGRLLALEQGGRILLLPEDRQSSNTVVFLDISDRKPHRGNEEGLLGFDFHPDYRNNRKFYIYYSQQNPRRSVLSEWKVDDKTQRAAPATERVLLEIPQPYENHNGGIILFGPDQYLYVSLGDGGAANDPHDHGQKLSTLLGKLLRLDVNKSADGNNYAIPSDNPFVGRTNARPEIWAYGLRNIWRMSFDRKTGELWAGDVGQNKWEEIVIIKKGGNYGWNFREGFHPFKTNAPPADAHFIEPIVEYPHSPQIGTNHLPGLSVTGGYVYRGTKWPSLQGVYLYADFTMGTIWGLRYQEGKVTANAPMYVTPKGTAPRAVASFGEDLKGELYLLTFDDKIYHLGLKQ